MAVADIGGNVTGILQAGNTELDFTKYAHHSRKAAQSWLRNALDSANDEVIFATGYFELACKVTFRPGSQYYSHSGWTSVRS